MADRIALSLIERLRSGDLTAWSEILGSMSPRLMRYFHRVGVDHHLAEDLTQEVFVTVYRKVHELRDPETFEGWVLVIAKNRLRSRLRRRRPVEELVLEESAVARDSLTKVYDDDLRRLVKEELRALRPGAQELVTLRVLEGRSASEVAALLGIDRDIQRRRLHVALKALRDRLWRRLYGAPMPAV